MRERWSARGSPHSGTPPLGRRRPEDMHELPAGRREGSTRRRVTTHSTRPRSSPCALPLAHRDRGTPETARRCSRRSEAVGRSNRPSTRIGQWPRQAFPPSCGRDGLRLDPSMGRQFLWALSIHSRDQASLATRVLSLVRAGSVARPPSGRDSTGTIRHLRRGLATGNEALGTKRWRRPGMVASPRRGRTRGHSNGPRDVRGGAAPPARAGGTAGMSAPRCRGTGAGSSAARGERPVRRAPEALRYSLNRRGESAPG